MKLYSFFNSSASFRVRIALRLKAIECEVVPINIRSGEQASQSYLGAVSPSPLVPVLEVDGVRISQSIAIIDWLDHRYPNPTLIPSHADGRAKVLELANLIACDITPLNNLRVLRYLENTLALDAETRQTWYQHWIEEGMRAVERILVEVGQHPFSFGDEPSLADCCLIPQVANALRMNCVLAPYPRACAIYEHAMGLAAFQQAAPAAQPDFKTP